MTKPSSYELVLLVVVGGASVLSGVAPVSRAVWFTEMFWAWGLVAILLLTYRRFRFSAAAYSCFFVRRSSVRKATNGTRRRTSSATHSARFVQY